MDSQETGTLIRVPATANLMLDSLDRDIARFPQASDFFITKNASIMNGFFNRIATTEVVMEWFVPNIATAVGNTIFSVSVGGTPYNVTIPDGLYDVESVLSYISLTLNAQTAPGVTWNVEDAISGRAYLNASAAWTLLPTLLQGQLGMTPGASAPIPGIAGTNGIPVVQPDLRRYRYLDIVSDQLTYNQDLKDDSTLPNARSVLCRWYMSQDLAVNSDLYGYPIFLGYTPFVLRRIYNPPKQIKWDRIQPVGQVSFQVYPDGQNTPLNSDKFNWLITLQVSEN